MRRSLLPLRPGWTDKLLIFFFLVACQIWSLVAVAFLLPGRAKDLLAPRYMLWPFRVSLHLEIRVIMVVFTTPSVGKILYFRLLMYGLAWNRTQASELKEHFAKRQSF